MDYKMSTRMMRGRLPLVGKGWWKDSSADALERASGVGPPDEVGAEDHAHQWKQDSPREVGGQREEPVQSLQLGLDLCDLILVPRSQGSGEALGGLLRDPLDELVELRRRVASGAVPKAGHAAAVLLPDQLHEGLRRRLRLADSELLRGVLDHLLASAPDDRVRFPSQQRDVLQRQMQGFALVVDHGSLDEGDHLVPEADEPGQGLDPHLKVQSRLNDEAALPEGVSKQHGVPPAALPDPNPVLYLVLALALVVPAAEDEVDVRVVVLPRGLELQLQLLLEALHLGLRRGAL
mmetsp:Transcript_2790/g.7651  ORF Transcript_2790/g.7651 Transcript_2790/m.7651 type:complete len:292 (+) Transcript_2790:23-898(+)